MLEKTRLSYTPKQPNCLLDFRWLTPRFIKSPELHKDVHPSPFPLTGGQLPVVFENSGKDSSHTPKRFGVVFSGGQASGGHNVISGVFDGLSKKHPGSTLLGFLNGPEGIVKNSWKILTTEIIDLYRNMGGFDMIGSGRTKIETPEQFAAARAVVQELDLDALVIVGGDDSNTNAAFLTENFRAHSLKTCVVGVPKTIDGDLKNQWIETSFGFDTACKTYAETIGSLARDAVSAGKYYYFIKLMGRSASHIALECALQTQPNYALISEEVAKKRFSLCDIVKEISDIVCRRSEQKKDYGVVLIPEGLLEFIPECKALIVELNALLADGSSHVKAMDLSSQGENKIGYICEFLTTASKTFYQTLPQEIQLQLILDRDPHGNVQVSKIETERLLMQLVSQELKHRKTAGGYKGSFSPQPHFCGYEGRSCLPSNFDAHYCYALGHAAVLLASAELTGYMACVRRLAALAEDWEVCGIPLETMMHQEVRKGKPQWVIRKTLVDIEGAPFRSFVNKRTGWVVADAYLHPGPIQFYGPQNLADSITKTLAFESRSV